MQIALLVRIGRILSRLLLTLLSLAVLLFVVMMYWLFFYDSDLPNIQAMSSFAPQTPTVIPEASICDDKTKVVAIPTGEMTDLRNALLAAEGDVDPRNALSRLYEDLVGEPGDKRYGSYSLQISRQLFCKSHGGMLKRQISELRASVQLERHFTTDQLLDIYLNRAYFGPGIYGIENAAEEYYAKPATQLSLPDVALLVGIVGNPHRLSPQAHPNRALIRRNEVIDAMAQRGSITLEQAAQAKGTPLGTDPKKSLGQKSFHTE